MRRGAPWGGQCRRGEAGASGTTGVRPSTGGHGCVRRGQAPVSQEQVASGGGERPGSGSGCVLQGLCDRDLDRTCREQLSVSSRVSGSSPSARHSPRRFREWIDLLSRKVQAKKGIRQGLIQLLCSSVRILSWESLLPGPKRALPAALGPHPRWFPPQPASQHLRLGRASGSHSALSGLGHLPTSCPFGQGYRMGWAAQPLPEADGEATSL